jgi:uncharacterized repeat protein (TIGR01451 family)
MKTKYFLVLSILVASILASIQIGCSTESSPTEPAVPAVESASQEGVGVGEPERVAGPGVDIEKLTNGIDADDPPGPSIPIGDPVEWSYIVTNIGDVALTSIVVDDDQLGSVTCPADALRAGQSMTCTLQGNAVEGEYRNEGRARASDGTNRVSDIDVSHYTGTDDAFAAIEVQKSTNGEDADDPTGPIVNVGDPIQWTYVVTNIGNVQIAQLSVTDRPQGTVPCRADSLAPGESTNCALDGTAESGQYTNQARASAQSRLGEVTDTDLSHYFGSDPDVSLDKLTEGGDGQELPVGCPVTWTYDVTNTGNIELTDIVVSDDKQPGFARCPSTSLDPSDTMRCQLTGTVTEGLYENLGTVTANAEVDNEVEASDASSYTGVVVPPTCEDAYPSEDILWPPNHKFVSVSILGVEDACGVATTITVDSIFQDEPTNGLGDGDTAPDGAGLGTSTAELRAERSGTANGRVYHIGFTATDDRGVTCEGLVKVGVPHDKKDTPIDEGPLYDSTGG